MPFDPEQLLLLIVFPIIGAVIPFIKLTTRTSIIIIAGLSIALLPALFGYDYFLYWMHEALLTGLLAMIYSQVLLRLKLRWVGPAITVGLTSGCLMFFCFYAFLNLFSGSHETAKHWEHGAYEVRYIKSQGFVARPRFSYNLIHKPIFGLLEKNKEFERVKKDSVIIFDDSKMIFDKHNGIIIPMK